MTEHTPETLVEFLDWAKQKIPGVDIGKKSDPWQSVAKKLVKLAVLYREKMLEQEYLMKQIQLICEGTETAMIQQTLELKDLKKRIECERFYLHKLVNGGSTREPF